MNAIAKRVLSELPVKYLVTDLVMYMLKPENSK